MYIQYIYSDPCPVGLPDALVVAHMTNNDHHNAIVLVKNLTVVVAILIVAIAIAVIITMTSTNNGNNNDNLAIMIMTMITILMILIIITIRAEDTLHICIYIIFCL